MDLIMAALIGLLVAIGAYLMMSGNLLRFLLGFSVFSNGVNLAIFQSGRLTYAAPPIIPGGAYEAAGVISNALPQALILTAIVIGFGLLAFSLVLVYRFYGAFGTVDADEVELAEPRA